ncbi:MAG: hypothetical protein CMJ58_03555 [Planctomycetaceae bacterium]|nr:hypothetical protein [Planctomycetaceae bacterium]
MHAHKAPVVEIAQAPSTGASAAASPPAMTVSGTLLDKMVTCASQGRYEQALKLARGKGGQSLDVQNAEGVCLMRLGRHEAAVHLYRGLVLNPGCTWMRRDRPAHYKVNFATALLLHGLTSGCLEMLGDLNGETTPMVDAIHQAIRKWEQGLPLLAWLNWKINRVAPASRPVPLGFPPGDFGNARPLLT